MVLLTHPITTMQGCTAAAVFIGRKDCGRVSAQPGVGALLPAPHASPSFLLRFPHWHEWACRRGALLESARVLGQAVGDTLLHSESGLLLQLGSP